VKKLVSEKFWFIQWPWRKSRSQDVQGSFPCEMRLTLECRARKLLKYTCQLSRLRCESHACGSKTSISRRLICGCRPISHLWLKKCELLPSCLKQCKKYVNSDPCKGRKPCVKWINNNIFLAVSDWLTDLIDWSEKHWERAHFYTFPPLKKNRDFFWGGAAVHRLHLKQTIAGSAVFHIRHQVFSVLALFWKVCIEACIELLVLSTVWKLYLSSLLSCERFQAVFGG